MAPPSPLNSDSTAPTAQTQARIQAFADRAVGDLVGALVVAMCSLGDRLGLFPDLAAHGNLPARWDKRAEGNKEEGRDSATPHQPTPLTSPSASATPPAARMAHRRSRAGKSGSAALALVAMLLVVFSSCSLTGTHGSGLASGSPTAGDGRTPSSSSDSHDATATATHTGASTATRTSAPTATATKTATPVPQKPSIHEVAQTTTFSGGSVIPATATCPQGELALGGGWSVPPQNARVFAAQISGGAWSVSASPVGHTASTTLTAYVECLRNAAGAMVTSYSTPLSVPASSFNGGTVGCAGSESIVGWGFSFGSGSSLELTASHPEITAAWTLEFVNHGGADQTGTLVAECLRNVNVSANRVNSSGVNVPMGATGSNQVSCPMGSAAAGGFQYSSGGGGNLYLMHATSTGWQAEAYAETTSIYFNVWAMCLFFQ